MRIDRETLARASIYVAAIYAVYGIWWGIAHGHWIAAQVSIALLAVARFHHVQRRRNFIVPEPETVQAVTGRLGRLRRRVAGGDWRWVATELVIAAVSLYVVVSILYIFGAQPTTIVAATGIGFVLIVVEKQRTANSPPITRPRL